MESAPNEVANPMESAPNEVATPPPLQRIEFLPSSNTTTTNSNNNCLQQNLEKLLLRISNMEISINDLQTRQVQIHPETLPSRSDTIREQELFLSMLLLIRNLVEEIYIPQELESCKSENRHAANQVSSGTSSKKKQTSLLWLPSLIRCNYMRKLLQGSGQHLLPVAAKVVAKNGNYLRKVTFKVMD